jgi:hypothetical protein
MKRQYERHLPHQVPEGFPIFLTWNLKGAFPKDVVKRLRDERARLTLGALCALVIVVDLMFGHKQHMWIMNIVWPVSIAD